MEQGEQPSNPRFVNTLRRQLNCSARCRRSIPALWLLAALAVAFSTSSLAIASPSLGGSSTQGDAWRSCKSFMVVSYSGERYDILDFQVREASCAQARAVVQSFHSQVIGSSGATVAEDLGCSYIAGGDQVLCKSLSGNSYDGPVRVRWRPSAAGPDPGGGDIGSCRPFTARSGSSFGRFTFRATVVRRSAHISCSMARKLLKASYGAGPLRVVRTVYPVTGRPTYWLRGGWRCDNGAGGASCWNARKPQLNAIRIDSLTHGLAVQAEIRTFG
jgi:hypothetical protein